MLIKLISSLLFSLNLYAAATVPSAIQAENLLTGKPFSTATKLAGKKGLVLVFMSAKCPCSNSHVPVLKKLATQYKDFKFLVVHSNLDETKAEAKKYFKEAGFNFEVLQDRKTKLADQFQAFKTPHAFIIGASGQIVYQGGITNSSDAEGADEFFLADALADIAANKSVRKIDGRTLGCVISRENEIYAK